MARKQSVITTFSSAENALLRKVTGDMTSLTKSLTNMMPALSKRYRLITARRQTFQEHSCSPERFAHVSVSSAPSQAPAGNSLPLERPLELS